MDIFMLTTVAYIGIVMEILLQLTSPKYRDRNH